LRVKNAAAESLKKVIASRKTNTAREIPHGVADTLPDSPATDAAAYLLTVGENSRKSLYREGRKKQSSP